METKKEMFSGLTFPTTTHQSMVGWLYTEIAVCLRRRQVDCQVIASPFAVFLEDEEDIYLKPDITVVGDRGKLDDEGCHGAPDWVVEVVSPDSRAFDYGRKLAAYIDAGVREYWIVDPEKQTVVAYYLEHPDVPVIYRFGDVVKSDIYEGLEVDTSSLIDIHYERKDVNGPAEGYRPDRGRKGVSDAQGVPENLRGEGNSGYGDAMGEAERKQEAFLRQSRNETRMMSVEEVKTYMRENFAELVSAGNKGQMMKAAIGALKGKADSKTFNEAVAELCRA